MTYQQNHQSNITTSYSKFDFPTICAGVLFLINHPTHLERLQNFLIPDSFFAGDDHTPVKALRVLVKVLTDMVRTDGVGMINSTYFSSKVSGLFDSDDNKEAQRLLRDMLSNPETIRKSLDIGCQKIFIDFLKANEIMRWADKFTPKWKSGDMAEATQSMKVLTSSLDKIKLSSVEEIIDVASLNMDELMGFLTVGNQRNGDLFFIGNKGLDDAIGGFERRALHIFIGPTNSGKSMMSHHLISRSIKQNMQVHIAVVEDRPKSFMRRLFANITGIKINRIKFAGSGDSPPFTKEEMTLLAEAQAKINKFVKVDFCYGESIATIHQRKREYDSERESKGLLPYSVDIIDYSGHIAVNSVGDKMYEKYRNAFAERKDFCLLNNKFGFDFAQLNREGFKKKEQGVIMSHGDLAGAYDLSQVCDNIIVLYRTKDHEQDHDIELVVTKVKDGILSREGYKVGEQFECARWDMDKHNGSKTVDCAQTMRVKDDTKEPRI